MIRFDAYSATTTAAKPPDLVSILFESSGFSGVTMSQGRGFHTFGERVACKDESGEEIGAVMWGGRQGDRCMIEVKGTSTPAAVSRLRERFEHRVTRVDSCADFDTPTAFDDLLRSCLQVKKAHRLKGSKLGDWEDFPEDGRTMYLGAPSSVSRVRLYEKGKQPEYRHLGREHWTRIEVQVRPAKEAKHSYAQATPEEVWGASNWTRELAALVLEHHIDPHPAGTTYRLTERDRALSWMCRQYGAHLLDLAKDLGGWDCVGLTLSEIISQQAGRPPRR